MTTALWLLMWLLTPQAATSSSIEGTVFRAETNQPLVNEQVGLWPTSRTTRTDRLGKFLFRNVAPGEYALVVIHDRIRVRLPIVMSAVPHEEKVMLEVKPAPAITGTVFDPYGERAAATRVQAFRNVYRPSGPNLRQVMSVMSDDSGEYRLFRIQPGEYYVSASLSDRDRRLGSPGLRLTPNLSRADDGFPDLYFGGGYTPSQSQKVHLSESDSTGTNIYLKEGSRFSVNGRLIGPDGDACGRLAVVPEGGLVDPEKDFIANVCGPFRIAGLSPGVYFAMAVGPGMASDATQFAIQNRNVEGVGVVMSRTVTVNGRASGISGIAGSRVVLVRNGPGPEQKFQGIVERDGRFTIPDVGKGFFDVYLDPLPDKAFVRSIRYGLVDGLLRNGLTFEGGQPTGRGSFGGLDIQASQGVTADGVALDAAGRPVPGAQVVLVPENYRHREDRYITAIANVAGEFRLSGIPPGTHTLFAFDQIEPGAYYAFSYDTNLLIRYAPRGQRLVFGESGEADREGLKTIVVPASETLGGLR